MKQIITNAKSSQKSNAPKNYYNLRSRRVDIVTPKPNKRKRSVQASKKSKKPRHSEVEIRDDDPDSGFAEDDFLLDNIVSTTPRFEHWKKSLHRIEKKRDTGLYIECCNLNCKKLRYCEDYHDPIDVPELWFCHDLGEGITCATPEQVLPDSVLKDLIENIYTAGSLVWGHFTGYPWWPAMVCDSPETLSYYKLRPRSDIPGQYHVIYFSNVGKIERSWLYRRQLKPFAKTPRNSLNKKKTYWIKDFTAEVDGAYEIANAILANELTLSERLAGFSFLSLYGGYSPSTIASSKRSRSARFSSYVNDSSSVTSCTTGKTDVISGTPQKTPKLRSYLQKQVNRKLNFD